MGAVAVMSAKIHDHALVTSGKAVSGVVAITLLLLSRASVYSNDRLPLNCNMNA